MIIAIFNYDGDTIITSQIVNDYSHPLFLMQGVAWCNSVAG